MGLNQPGVHQPELPGCEEEVPGGKEEQARLKSVIKKRMLYKQVEGTKAPWFPHDNDPELLRELIHEAGTPRWVFHGTPASGAGVHGCMEASCSVVLLCFDEHHRTELRKAMVQRSVEHMVAGTTMVFKDADLQQRGADLHLSKAASADDDAVPNGNTGKNKKAEESEPEQDSDKPVGVGAVKKKAKATSNNKTANAAKANKKP